MCVKHPKGARGVKHNSAHVAASLWGWPRGQEGKSALMQAETRCGRCGGPMPLHWFTVRRCDRCICWEINYLRLVNGRVPA